MNTRPPVHPRRSRAFTLIEISVVLLLMAILAAVALPRWTEAIEQFRVTSAARRLAADLALAQASALACSRNQIVTFSLAGHYYELVNVSSLERASDVYRTRLNLDPYRSRLVSLFGSLSDQQVVFNGFGVPSQGGSIVIACGSKQRTVFLDSESGLAQVQE